jgi:hypothetical protein
MQVPDVRDRIARAASEAHRGMSAEEFLAMGDTVLGGVVPTAVPLSKVVDIVQPIATRLGIKNHKRRSEQVAQPPGRVLVGVMCSLALRSMTISAVHQASDGCVIEAEVPSSMWVTSAGLVATVTGRGDATEMEAAVTARGQMYDWGKGKAALNALFDDVARYAAPDLVD